MIVLDTHTWLWWIQGTAEALPSKTKALIEHEPGPVGIASVSLHFLPFRLCRRRLR